MDKLTSLETKEAGGRRELREYLTVLAQAVASGKVVLLNEYKQKKMRRENLWV